MSVRSRIPLRVIGIGSLFLAGLFFYILTRGESGDRFVPEGTNGARNNQIYDASLGRGKIARRETLRRQRKDEVIQEAMAVYQDEGVVGLKSFLSKKSLENTGGDVPAYDAPVYSEMVNRIMDENDREKIASWVIADLALDPDSLFEFADALRDPHIAAKSRQRWIYEAFRLQVDPQTILQRVEDVRKNYDSYNFLMIVSPLQTFLESAELPESERARWNEFLTEYPEISEQVKRGPFYTD